MVRMATGDGSPCDRAWEWFERKGFATYEQLQTYLIENSEELNDYMQECADNYPWEPEPEIKKEIDTVPEKATAIEIEHPTDAEIQWRWLYGN